MELFQCKVRKRSIVSLSLYLKTLLKITPKRISFFLSQKFFNWFLWLLWFVSICLEYAFSFCSFVLCELFSITVVVFVILMVSAVLIISMFQINDQLTVFLILSKYNWIYGFIFLSYGPSIWNWNGLLLPVSILTWSTLFSAFPQFMFYSIPFHSISKKHYENKKYGSNQNIENLFYFLL